MQVEGDDEVQSRLSQVNGAVGKTGQSMEGGTQKTGAYSGALGQLSETTESTRSRTEVLGGTLKQSALGISSVAASATNLYFQYDNLNKVSLRVESAEKNLLGAKSQLIGAQERANKLNEEGITSGAAYEKAQLDLQRARRQALPRCWLDRRKLGTDRAKLIDDSKSDVSANDRPDILSVKL